MDSPSREHFYQNLAEGGKYTNLIAIYRHNTSADRIGIFDAELVNKLPASLKWIAHNGAGYDQIDIGACKVRGESLKTFRSPVSLTCVFFKSRHQGFQHAWGSRRCDRNHRHVSPHFRCSAIFDCRAQRA